MKSTLKNQKICFVGAGSMAEAIARGLIDRKKAHADHVFMINLHNQNRLEELRKRYGVQTHSDSKIKSRFVQDADIIILAMKPKDVESALKQIKPLLSKDQLLISVIAGLTIKTIYKFLDTPIAVARTMPNTSSTIGFGATGISFSDEMLAEHKEQALEIFESVGIVRIVEEKQLDIVTGLSGSGPAYIYYMMEAMIQAGVEGGLSEETAKELTVQTVLGAANMVKMTNEEPGNLRRKVTSPGGTTQAALELMETGKFPETVRQAVLRASERAGELSALIINPKQSE
jgi:pyrroline-5-carboxylate reductase